MATKTQIVLDSFGFAASLNKEVLGMAEAAEIELEAMAGRIAERAKSIEGIPGPIRDSIGVEKVPGYVNVGVLPSSPIRITTGGDEKPSRAATALEYGHVEADGSHVQPHPFMRPAIAEEIAGSGGSGKLPAFPEVKP